MKILKSLNKKNFLILFFLFFISVANSEEKPVDIWNIEENKEIEIIKEFLPQQLSHEEVEKVCSDIISSSGAASLKDMGKVMQILKEKYLGKIDFSFAGKILKEKLKG